MQLRPELTADSCHHTNFANSAPLAMPQNARVIPLWSRAKPIIIKTNAANISKLRQLCNCACISLRVCVCVCVQTCNASIILIAHGGRQICVVGALKLKWIRNTSGERLPTKLLPAIVRAPKSKLPAIKHNYRHRHYHHQLSQRRSPPMRSSQLQSSSLLSTSATVTTTITIAMNDNNNNNKNYSNSSSSTTAPAGFCELLKAMECRVMFEQNLTSSRSRMHVVVWVCVCRGKNVSSWQ